MSKYFFIILFLNSFEGNSQNVQIDSFYMLRSEFLHSRWTELTIVDTLKNTKDSLIINSKNKKGFIRQRIDIKNDTGCVKKSSTNYIDTNDNLVYIEYWNFTCQNTDPNDYDGVLNTYRRLLYDENGQLISEFVDNSGTGTWRYDYLYSKNGDRYSKLLRIRRNEFWND
jgi:hypothetical protein